MSDTTVAAEYEAPAQTPAELFASLQAARAASVEKAAEQTFLVGAPWRLALFAGILGYGFVKPSTSAKWVGGLGLAELAIEYFVARRRQSLATSPATSPASPQGAT